MKFIMQVNATLINLFHVCKRECWLHANGIRMEQTSDIVYEGKLISETTYQQRARKYIELDMGIAKIDFYDPKAKVVHEVKKSNKMDHAHEWQVKYYLFLLEKSGIEGVTGLLEYPKLRETKEVYLSQPDREFIAETVEKIEKLVAEESCPPRVRKSICRNCSYYDFCWSEEEN